MIPLLKPSCTQAEIDAVKLALQSGWWGMGPKCEEFEHKLARLYYRKHCVTVNSGTAALHLACLANGIGPGDEVIVPALTFISTALAVTYCGAKPIFADVSPDTLCLDLNSVLAKITHKTKAIIGVDYAGYPVIDRENIRIFFEIPDWIELIQDAAHSCGGLSWGNELCLSFHPVKCLATGDGGAIVTDDPGKAERIRALRWCGIDRSTWERAKGRYGWDYSIGEIGYKCHWNDIQAAVGLAQLGRLAEMRDRRRLRASIYMSELSNLVECPLDHPEHTWHLYVIRVPAEMRNGLMDHLLESGISAGVHYKPLTYYPIYDDQPTPPVTERECRRLISLPIYADMTDEEQEKVIGSIKTYYGRYTCCTERMCDCVRLNQVT